MLTSREEFGRRKFSGMVENRIPKLKVAGSNPVSRSILAASSSVLSTVVRYDFRRPLLRLFCPPTLRLDGGGAIDATVVGRIAEPSNRFDILRSALERSLGSVTRRPRVRFRADTPSEVGAKLGHLLLDGHS